jgi:hypothetical protein
MILQARTLASDVTVIFFGDSGMEAAFWEASIQQYLLASQCWAHLGALVVPGIALQWLWSPGFGDLSGF